MKRIKVKKKILFCLAAILVLLGGYCFIEPHWLKITEHVVTSKDVPDSFSGTKIVFISDIHHGPFFSRSRVADLVERINRLNPDMVILGGDYVHRNRKYIQPFFDELRKLKTMLGVYAVLGNRDHWEDAQLTRELMARNGINNCDNKSYWVKRGDGRIKRRSR